MGLVGMIVIVSVEGTIYLCYGHSKYKIRGSLLFPQMLQASHRVHYGYLILIFF